MLQLPNKVKKKITSLDTFSPKGNRQRLGLNHIYWMWHLASLYFPYDKPFESTHTVIKIVFKIWLIQNILQKKKKGKKFPLTKRGDTLEVTFQFLCNSQVPFISCMYLKWSSQKRCSSQIIDPWNFKKERKHHQLHKGMLCHDYLPSGDRQS